MNRAIFRSASHSAFTLIEICIAIGIFAFSIVAILGLFPIAMDSTKVTRNSTYCAQIGRTLLGQLRGGKFDAASYSTSSTTFATADLRSAGTFYVAFGDDATPIRNLAGLSDFQTAATDKKENFRAKVEFAPVDASRVAPPRLTRVTVSVEYPASAPTEHRDSETFITFVSETESAL